MSITLALKEAIEMVQEGLLALLGVETPPALSLPCTTIAQCWAVTSASNGTPDDRWRSWDDFWCSRGHC